MKSVRIYTIQNIDMMHIAEFAERAHRSVQSCRHLIEQGNAFRKMKFFRDRSRVMLPVAEIEGFPFLGPGKSAQDHLIYHYVLQEDGTYKRVFCPTCSYSQEYCEARKRAEALIVPKGDD